MIIDDLLAWPERRSLTAMPEVDALAEPDALFEAALLDVKMDRPVTSEDGFSCTAELTSGSSLQMAGSAAEFYVGDVPGGDDPPPDFTSATDAEIRAGLASWTSEFEAVHASFV